MPTYTEVRAGEILDVVRLAQGQIWCNEVWEAAGIPLQFNEEGKAVETQPTLFAILMDDPGGDSGIMYSTIRREQLENAATTY